MVPNESATRKWAAEAGFAQFPYSSLCDETAASLAPSKELSSAREKLKEFIIKDLHRIGAESQLLGYQQVRLLAIISLLSRFCCAHTFFHLAMYCKCIIYVHVNDMNSNTIYTEQILNTYTKFTIMYRTYSYESIMYGYILLHCLSVP